MDSYFKRFISMLQEGLRIVTNSAYRKHIEERRLNEAKAKDCVSRANNAYHLLKKHAPIVPLHYRQLIEILNSSSPETLNRNIVEVCSNRCDEVYAMLLMMSIVIVYMPTEPRYLKEGSISINYLNA